MVFAIHGIAPRKPFISVITHKNERNERVGPDLFRPFQGCLLCSEHRPHHCHRQLVAEYLNAKWGGIEVKHLG